jgi:hypothetical protein
MWSLVRPCTNSRRNWKARRLLSSTWFDVSPHCGDTTKVRATLQLSELLQSSSGSGGSGSTSDSKKHNKVTTVTSRNNLSSTSSFLQGQHGEETMPAPAAPASPSGPESGSPEQLAAAAALAYLPADTLEEFLKFRCVFFMMDRCKTPTAMDIRKKEAAHGLTVKASDIGRLSLLI